MDYGIRSTDETDCDLVTSYGDTELGQHWTRKWTGAVITWILTHQQ